MKAQEERVKTVQSPKRSKVAKDARKKTREESDNQPTAPLTTADLAISPFQYFSERIEFKGVYRSELWPRHKIVTT